MNPVDRMTAAVRAARYSLSQGRTPARSSSPEAAMKKTTRIPLVLGAVAAIATASSCVDANAAVFIAGVLPVNSNTGCTAAPGSGLYQASGVLDIGAAGTDGNTYIGAVEVVTNLPATFNTQDVTQSRQRTPNFPNYGNADTNIILFQEAEVFLTLEDGSDVANAPSQGAPRISTVGGSVANEQSNLGQETAVFIPLVTSDEANRLQASTVGAALTDATKRARVVANVRVRGRTTGGSVVTSGLFSYPIELCKRCLVGVGTTDGVNCADPNQVLTANPDACTTGADEISSYCE